MTTYITHSHKKQKKKQKKKAPPIPSRTASLQRQLKELIHKKQVIETGQKIEVDFFELQDLLDWVKAQEHNNQTMWEIVQLAAKAQFPLE